MTRLDEPKRQMKSFEMPWRKLQVAAFKSHQSTVESAKLSASQEKYFPEKTQRTHEPFVESFAKTVEIRTIKPSVANSTNGKPTGCPDFVRGLKSRTTPPPSASSETTAPTYISTLNGLDDSDSQTEEGARKSCIWRDESGRRRKDASFCLHGGHLYDIFDDDEEENSRAKEGARKSCVYRDDFGRHRKEASFCLAGGHLYNVFDDAEWDDLDDVNDDSDSDSDSLF
mmetsp:Transcript_59580/g.176641  ORF Transcript_59580/g.176641 Transcript_59580/m.176641 type:complete len:227 (-) Transcript_59580:65-745(-)